MFSEFRKACKKLVPEYAKYLELPPKGMGDLALPCFAMAKAQKKKPQEAAIEIVESIKIPKNSLVKKVEAIGPYVNFFIDYEKFGTLVLKEGVKQSYGKGEKKKEKVVVESPGPNTNKPLHLGHMRNMALGISLSRILEFAGNKVIRVDIVNDRGIHICRSMLAYKKLGNRRQPDKKSDHFVGDYYVLFSKELKDKPETEEELRQMLLDWENEKKDVRELWKTMRKWSLDGMKKTFDRFGVQRDKVYYESDHYKKGKAIAAKYLKSGTLKKDEDGNIIADLENMGLGKRVLLRKDGTSVYLTQDVSLALQRHKDFNMDKVIYIVADEQQDHFRALFKVLEVLGFEFAKKSYHLSYGMVYLPEGKMKSREGNVVDADNLMDEMQLLARHEIEKREPNTIGDELKERAEKIGLAAIKFYVIKYDPVKSFVYDPQTSLSFEGDTGPYVMYTYARCKSILRKSKKKPMPGKMEEGGEIIKQISKFPEIVNQAAAEYKPHMITTYALELAAQINEYYHKVKVLESDKEKERLALIAAAAHVLSNCLYLLGIEPLEKM